MATPPSTTPSAIRVRPLEAADYETWLPLWHGYQAFYKTDIPEETTRVTWNRFLNPGEPMFGALAFDGDKAVGLVHWIYHRSCWTVGDYCYLQDLFVAEGRRGGGLGRTLIEYVYDTAKAAGCSRVHWLTHETNTDAMKLYDRIADRSGFVQYRKLLS
ncbi:GNAT family N-acetyltransferase [Azospirillum soli]|uniref:GNAT family N-acetyltransferase n=1 Tax=Azospirillum soli TaxID=1304799 RepID=UPI001FE7787B|nr:GNAT family N-acetyltransferase [Azospirillum soli]MBP2315693.1 GNAT superfamily N-acetyltransferase [Azospirillum soli]